MSLRKSAVSAGDIPLLLERHFGCTKKVHYNLFEFSVGKILVLVRIGCALFPADLSTERQIAQISQISDTCSPVDKSAQTITT